ncbi:hypothetical protein DN451_09895, partial [Lactobacillus reuteri]|nr:hypothetical protein [Limosilactobacillus reuteri]
MMKRPEFLETKRTPRYSLRKLNVGVASVLLGVTIFGINFTNHSVKAATTESVTQKATSATREVQRSSGSNTATANNSIEAATTPQSSPETQGSADTDIRSLAARSAAKLAFMNLMAASGTDTDTGRTAAGTPDTGRTAAGTPDTGRTATGTPDTGRTATGTSGTDRSGADVDGNNINTQPAKENQELANKTNLTSSDNYSSNIYKGKDGKYYKIVTIYGNDYVYHAADIQANGVTPWYKPQKATTAEDTKNNINISKEDLGNGQTRWTVIFFPHRGLQNYGGTLHGLSNAKFGIALTSDYQIVGNVDMEVISDPNQSFMSHTFKPGSNSATNFPIQNLSAEKDFSFNPKTDVDPNTGLINSETMPAYNNQYLQGPYYFTTATDTGKKNLWQTYFKDDDESKNAYDGSPYLGDVHDFHLNNFEIKNKTGVDGAKQGDPIIYDTLGYSLNSKNGVANSNGVFSSDNFTQAMEFKSQGDAGNGQSQFSSYVISFTTQHTDSHEVGLSTGSNSKNQQFSGIAANIHSYQNSYYNMFSRLYGEQRALTPADAADPYAPLDPKDIIPNWVPANEAMKNIHTEYLNNAQINVLRNKIQNNITDPDAVNNIIKEGNSLNDAMKNLGNSIGQYDSDGKFTDHKVDTTKASERYKYADSKKKSAYDTATDAVSNIISVENGTVNKSKGTYADLDTVKKLTDNENKAWSALDGVKPDAESYTVTPKEKVPVDKGEDVDPSSLVNVTDPDGKPTTLPTGSIEWKDKPDLTTPGDKTGRVEVTFPDGSKKDTDVTIYVKTDAETYDPKAQPFTTTVGKTPKADEVISSTDKHGKKMPSDANYAWKTEPNTSKIGEASGEVTVTYDDGSHDDVAVTINVKDNLNDNEKYHIYGKDGLKVDKGQTLDPKDAIDVKDADGKETTLPEKSKVEWTKDKEPDFSQAGKDVTGEVTVTYPDHTQSDSVPVTVHVNGESDKYKVAPKDNVIVPRGSQVEPESTVVAQTPNGKPTSFPGGTKHEWITKPDTSTTGNRTGVVKTTFPDGSTTTTTVSVNVEPNQSDKYDPKAQPFTTTVGKTPKADEVISSTDKHGKKMPSDANYAWKTEPNTSKIGEASGEVTVTYDDGSHDDVAVTINVKDNLNDNEKYHIYGKDGLKVDKGQTLDPKDAIDVKDADGKETTLPEKSKVEWTKDKEPDFSQAGKDVTGEVTVTYPDHTQSDSVPVTVHVNGESDKYKVAPKDNVIVPRGSQVEPESTVVAQTPNGKPTSFPGGTKHEWITKPDTSTTGNRTGVVKTTFPDGSTTTTTVSVT